MSTSSVGGLSSSYLQQVLASALQSVTGSSKTSGASSASSVTQSDSAKLSPFAQIAATLQSLQQSNPAEYKQVTDQVANALQSAAKTATSNGDTAAASQLTRLATDFSNASATGQLPNLQDLAQAVGAGGGRRHRHHGSSEAQTPDAPQSSSSNPASIILNVLANATNQASSTSSS